MLTPDQIIRLAKRAYESLEPGKCLELLARLPDTPPVKELKAQASYQEGKIKIAAGDFASAKELFSLTCAMMSPGIIHSLGQERNHLLNQIQQNRNRSVLDLRGTWENAKVGEASTIPGDAFEPDIWFVGCAAAYRSGYSVRSGDPLSQLIRLLKQGTGGEALDKVSEILVDYTFSCTPTLSRVDFIVPVPGDPIRTGKRGYSIPLALAKGISEMCAVPLHDEMMSTSGETPDLRQVPRWYRSKAVEGAFEVQMKPDWIAGRSILLVDDIITTGSTMKEMAKAMAEFGAGEIAAVALCHTEN